MSQVYPEQSYVVLTNTNRARSVLPLANVYPQLSQMFGAIASFPVQSQPNIKYVGFKSIRCSIFFVKQNT